ncbi:hypothetical protein ACQ4WY_25640 [Janthinobacterium sp. LB2P49]|uniref:hypothetical protein n=1 Tax=Janthinobacterium sp. LB2P49 TaxID=3424198 RepID=UPI003F20DB95
MISVKAVGAVMLLAWAGVCRASTYSESVDGELAWTWGELQSVMTAPELAKAKSLKLTLLKADTGAMKVRISSSGEIEMSLGVHIRAQEACTMVEYVRLLSSPNVNKAHLLQGYSSYLAEAEAFGPFFLSARAYLERVDSKTDYRGLYGAADDNLQVAACRTGLLTFLLAHEFAHAFAGDPISMDKMAADEVNKLEQKADAAALDLLARRKTFPVAGMLQFLLAANHIMHEPAQTEFASFDHPLPFDRLLKTLSFAIANFDKYLSAQERKVLGPSIQEVPKQLALLRDQVAKWKAVQEKYNNTSAKNDGLMSFFLNDATYAIRVPSVYLHGSHGSEVDLPRARIYFQRAAQVLPPSFYYQQAAALYGAGLVWSTEPNPSYERACSFLARAEAMHLLAATERLKMLRKNEKCN